MEINVSVIGATGYAGLEAIRILARHPQARVVSVPSRREEGTPISTIHPELRGRCELTLSTLDPNAIASGCDAAISCLPHGASHTHCAALRKLGVKVVDVSADYRLKDPARYQQWYGTPHEDPRGLAEAVYGLPELFADQIRSASLVANPGCYPTAAILALAPLAAKGIASPSGIVVDAKSGVSGAGKKLTDGTHFPRANENVAPYAVGTHRHTPEISGALSTLTGTDLDVLFVPHLTPMNRGILATCYVCKTKNVSQDELQEIYSAYYADAPFVRVLEPDAYPTTADVAHTNYADVAVRVCGDRIVAMGAIDNLVKGASGQAVQNLNLMFGLDEALGLGDL